METRRKTRLSINQRRDLIRAYSEQLSTRAAAKKTDVNRKTASLFYTKVRESLLYLECDESISRMSGNWSATREAVHRMMQETQSSLILRSVQRMHTRDRWLCLFPNEEKYTAETRYLEFGKEMIFQASDPEWQDIEEALNNEFRTHVSHYRGISSAKPNFMVAEFRFFLRNPKPESRVTRLNQISKIGAGAKI